MDEVDHLGEHVGVGLGDDAVAEVEDVATGGPAGREDGLGPGFDGVPRREERGRAMNA